MVVLFQTIKLVSRNKGIMVAMMLFVKTNTSMLWETKTSLMPMFTKSIQTFQNHLVVLYGLVWDHLGTLLMFHSMVILKILTKPSNLKQQLMIQIHGIGQYGTLTTWRSITKMSLENQFKITGKLLKNN